MKTVHDKPNVTYQLMGKYIEQLASIGATDFELQHLCMLGGKASLKDIAEIEMNHTKYIFNIISNEGSLIDRIPEV